MKFDLTSTERTTIWEHLIHKLEHYYSHTEEYKTSIYPKRETVTNSITKDFGMCRKTEEAIDEVLKGLSKYAVHTPNPNYYGMFNPRPNFPSIVADTITAVLNPQLAAWGHAQYAVEVEHMLIREIGKKFGYEESAIDGVFTSGGQEANLTGVLAALNHKFPLFAKSGVRSIDGLPTIYCSKASHHATAKAAKVCGLGLDSVRYVEIDQEQKMIVSDLKDKIENDIKDGKKPFIIVATMGTTGVGAIDPIDEIVTLAEKYEMWVHADAAYGGAVVLTEKYRSLLSGIEKADSITFDAHKWLSVPMAASLFITKHVDVLGKTFSILSDYMPHEEDEIDKLGSYTHSIQWSRRFIGLKLYMPLLVFGWKGYDETIEHQIKMGEYLNQKLLENNWILYNNTTLPISCFGDPRFIDSPDFAKYMYDSVLETGEIWINQYPVGDLFTLRACITNYATEERHIDELINLLNEKRLNFIP